MNLPATAVPASEERSNLTAAFPPYAVAAWPSVLVVDDRVENVKVIDAMMRGLEVKVLTATSGREALEVFDQQDLAAAMLDVCLPGMDGFEIARQMRARKTRVPILFVTASDRSAEAISKAYANGAADFLYKPLQPAVLRAKVQVFLDLFRLREAERSKVLELRALNKSIERGRMEAERVSGLLASQKIELEHHNNELQRLNTQMESFAHVVSHDLRQPLGGILNYLEVIAHSGDITPGGRTSRWIASCLRLGGDMQSLIDELLELSNLSGRLPVMAPVDMNHVLRDALDALRVPIEGSAALVTSDDLPTVAGSGRLLTSLFQNLICNAIKYRGEASPRVEIHCEPNPVTHDWCFRIRDNGRGFRQSEAERIFEMFGRGDNVAGISGSGLGLAICRKVVESHGGHIRAESEPGKGATFFFDLPDIVKTDEPGQR